MQYTLTLYRLSDNAAMGPVPKIVSLGSKVRKGIVSKAAIMSINVPPVSDPDL